MQSREIPKYMISRRYISAIIAFIVAFSALFMVIYKPFSLAIWFSTSDTLRFSLTILFYVAAVVVLIVSRSMMYALQDRYMMSINRYVLWLMCENVAISLLYTIITPGEGRKYDPATDGAGAICNVSYEGKLTDEYIPRA